MKEVRTIYSVICSSNNTCSVGFILYVTNVKYHLKMFDTEKMSKHFSIIICPDEYSGIYAALLIIMTGVTGVSEEGLHWHFNRFKIKTLASCSTYRHCFDIQSLQRGTEVKALEHNEVSMRQESQRFTA